MTKKIIHVLSQRVCNLPQTEQSNHWGLGDLLRGTQCLFEYCQKNGYEFELDISNHPIAEFFEPQKKKGDNLIKPEGIRFESFKNQMEMENFLNERLKHEDTIYFMTHGFGVWPRSLSKECKAFIQHVLRPNKENEYLISQKMPQDSNFEILHFRLGDKYLIEDTKDFFGGEFSLLLRNAGKNDLLISDSYEFKNYVAKHSNIKMFKEKPVHTGLSSSSDLLRDTLIEFMIATRSKKIKTYSNYQWTSGFALAINKVYDVPLLDLSGGRVWRAIKRRMFSLIKR
jgi:hypothetical protein